MSDLKKKEKELNSEKYKSCIEGISKSNLMDDDEEDPFHIKDSKYPFY